MQNRWKVAGLVIGGIAIMLVGFFSLYFAWMKMVHNSWVDTKYIVVNDDGAGHAYVVSAVQMDDDVFKNYNTKKKEVRQGKRISFHEDGVTVQQVSCIVVKDTRGEVVSAIDTLRIRSADSDIPVSRDASRDVFGRESRNYVLYISDVRGKNECKEVE